jgi:two-component system response regulator FlrC
MMRATVLVVEDDQPLREALSATLELGGYAVREAPDGHAALEIVGSEDVDLMVSDIQMRQMDGHALLKQVKAKRPDLPVLLMTAYGTIQSAVQAMRDGAADYLVKPFEAEVLVGKVAELLAAVPATAVGGDAMIAVDRATLDVLTLARRVATSDATVLIAGESGVGKEVLFRFLHANSRRSGGPAVAINCAAIPENMLEAILFGYEKGAFTGAYKSCAGKFEQAQGGSLLLDEISEMSLSLQAKLLRVLQERQVERLGGDKTIDLDVRVVATTNRDLKGEVAAGRFREDLYYRLNVFPLTMPPLRERVADIVPLAEFFLNRAASKAGTRPPRLTAEAGAALARHPWRGNVRELDNLMQRAFIIGDGVVIGVADLRFETAPAATVPATAPVEPADRDDGLAGDLKDHERHLILEALEEGRGSRKHVAEKLGISPRTLRYKLARMREAGIDVPDR